MLKKYLIAVCAVLVSWLVHGVSSGAGLTGKFEDPYYKDFPLFHYYPSAEDARYTMDKFGPVGMGFEFLQPAFTMRIIKIEPGSPAETTGRLKIGQYIESINGKVLKDIDPRVILGNLITEAEAKDGVLKLMVKNDPGSKAEEVIVRIPVLGAYGDTWPMNCSKSDRIVREFAEFLAQHPRGWGSAIFLLSTGEEKDLDVVRGWFSGKLPANAGGHPWAIGYTGPAICEYYLRTGDNTVLPAIKSMCDYLKSTIYNGSWMGRGGCNYNYMAGGHMNAAGVHDLTFLLLAKECGVDVDEHTLQSCLYHFYRYAGHWNVSYGDGLPEGGGTDNGKNGGLAFAMAAAASLTQEGEKSVYANARDISANKSFYTTSWLFHGHTGGGIGEIWRGAAAGLLAEKRPEMYRSFMNERRWMYELARGYDGSFGWAGGMNVNYNNTGHKGGMAWGNYEPLIYTIPRKKLRICGAPPTEFSKTFQLPERPWGTAADEVFYSLEPGEYKPGRKQDMTGESLPTHASWPILRWLNNPEVSDDDILMFASHPDSTSRGTAASAIASLNRLHLIVPLMKSKDPRARLTGVRALGWAPKGETPPPERLTDETIDLLGRIITDPEESWWVVIDALKVLGNAPPDKVAPYADRIAFWLKHEDWWLRHAALTAVKPIAVDKRYYKKILPIIGDMITANQRAVALGPVGSIVTALQEADPEIQAFAIGVFRKAYADYPSEFIAPGGQNMSNCVDYMLKGIARNLAATPGGFDALYEVSSKRFPNLALPHKELYMGADASRFGPRVRKALEPIVLNQLVPMYVGANGKELLTEVSSEAFGKNEPKVLSLVDLYQRIDNNEYNWHTFGPDLTEIKWMYHTFDPPEEKLWEPGTRFRTVSYPKGMENWFAADFDAAKAGWKSGYAPFGQMDGKLVTAPASCNMAFCRCDEPMKTFWDKEVLLMQAKMKLPDLQDGHIHRIVIGGMSHVNAGDGFTVYVNGKKIAERNSGVGKRQGGIAVCAYIDKSWWPVFAKEVTVSATSFLPIPGGKRSPGVKKNHFSVWFQEMKAPPVTGEMIVKGRMMQPMLCTAWQASRDDGDKYSYDGNFVENKPVLGNWMPIGQIQNPDDFEPGKDMSINGKSPLGSISLKDGGKTDNELVTWSGDTFMDFVKYQAHKMHLEKIDGKEYLFIESGGFNTKNPDDWTTMWTVMQRAETDGSRK